jgi:hypothetical protein
MAVRLPIVVSSHIQRSSQYSDYEESLVAELLFIDRLDATLIGPLAHAANDNTDGLCLEGLKGDFALVDWLSADATASELKRLQIDGHLVGQSSGANQPSERTLLPLADATTPKKVYHFQLDLARPATQQIAELQKLLEIRSTPTFNLSSMNFPKKADAASASPDRSETKTSPPATVETTKEDPATPKVSKSPVPQTISSESESSADSDEQAMDVLFDSFDELDF